MERASEDNGIRQATEDDRAAVKAVIERRLGHSYAENLRLMDIMQKEDCPVIVYYEEEILGVGIGYNFHTDSVLGNYTGNADVSELKAVAVRKGVEGKGIGTKCARTITETLENPVYAVSWLHPDGKDSNGLLEAIGYTRVGRIRNAWEQQSLGTDRFCPVCGSPCECDAAGFHFNGD